AEKISLFRCRRWRHLHIQHFGYFGANAGVGSNQFLPASDLCPKYTHSNTRNFQIPKFVSFYPDTFPH
ncbi:hypothetical protein NL448_28570, partial [Klebsiella pneumoniae]|nr:hypothetical protein [Klebsiella pneumoniae]